MKICTDATLFGAMAPIEGGEQVLDIGTGTGLLALMLTQLGAAFVTGVELTAAACSEAEYNFAHSPWHNRLHLIHDRIQNYAQGCRKDFDLIISNPPFFQSGAKTRNALRTLARHTDALPYDELLGSARKLLRRTGKLYLLIPTAQTELIRQLAASCELHLIERTDFSYSAQHQPKVCALLFSRTAAALTEKRIDIYSRPGIYAPASSHYLRPFLLRFQNMEQ